MKKIQNQSQKALKMLKKARGASMVEYALLLFGVLLVGAVVVKNLGSAVSGKAVSATSELNTPN